MVIDTHCVLNIVHKDWTNWLLRVGLWGFGVLFTWDMLVHDIFSCVACLFLVDWGAWNFLAVVVCINFFWYKYACRIFFQISLPSLKVTWSTPNKHLNWVSTHINDWYIVPCACVHLLKSIFSCHFIEN